MKTILISAFALLASISSVFAAENLQYIQCSFADSSLSDRVVVNIYSDLKSGTFFYTTGLNDLGDEPRTPALKISRENSASSDITSFLATYSGMVNGQNTSLDFHFSLPTNQVFKSANYIRAHLTTNYGVDSDLTCFARIYPKN